MKFVNSRIQEALARDPSGDFKSPESGMVYDAFCTTPSETSTDFGKEIMYYKGVETIMDLLNEYSAKHEIMCQADVDAFWRFVINRSEGVLYLRSQNAARS